MLSPHSISAIRSQIRSAFSTHGRICRCPKGQSEDGSKSTSPSPAMHGCVRRDRNFFIQTRSFGVSRSITNRFQVHQAKLALLLEPSAHRYFVSLKDYLTTVRHDFPHKLF